MHSKKVNFFIPIIFIIGLVFLLAFPGFLSRNCVLASENFFVTIVNPVRGFDFWGLEKQDPLTTVEEQLKIIDENELVVTWLLRPDVIFDPKPSEFFKTIPRNHELGIFLEVTPSWSVQAGVNYHQEVSWHYANSIFLSGYTLKEREKLIDSAFQKFKEIFGYYPKSVGAWHLDAKSLSYMEKKYKITSALICADQFLTDNYQIWGSWWGVPYYPSRFNTLIPAQSKKNKIKVVVFQWAARDPVNGYGGGVKESTYSIQANDYLKHGLDTSYFSKLVDFYTVQAKGKFGQITVGLENDYPWDEVGNEYKNQIKILAKKGIKALTMKEFSLWYQEKFPNLSPDHKIGGNDPLGTGKKAFWLMSINGRVGILEKDEEKIIRDWRLYNEKWAEPYLEVANQNSQLNFNLPAKIDSVRFPGQVEKLTQPPEDLLRQKMALPFSSSPAIFVLMGLIFGGFLIWGLRINKTLTLLMIFGIAAQAATMIKSGLLYSFGMGFWGPNGHDGIWHLALINELTRHFPPQNPVFAHSALSNYHYFFDLLVGLINKITGLSTVNLYFQIFPLIFSGLLGILTYLLVKKWTRDTLASLFAVFLVYFGGSFGWIITLLRHQNLGGESMFWANQSISFLINPPFALSILLMLFGFYLFLDYQKKPNKRLLILLGLTFGLVIGVKAYGGVVVLIGLALASFWEWWRNKKFTVGRVFIFSSIISLAIFWPNNQNASSLFVFNFLWFPHTMLSFNDRFGWVRLDQARQVYLTTGKWLKWILSEGLALVIFFVGNLGTRIVGLGKIFSWFRNFKKLDLFQVFFLGCLGISAIAPLLVVQKGNPWNSIQFFYYFLFLMDILSGWILGEWCKSFKKSKFLIIVTFIILTLPTTIGTLRDYLPFRAPARISFDELEALEFLRKQPNGIVLSYPHDYQLREKTEAPKPLFIYETTAYISAFSNKNSFLEDEMNLEIMQVDWKPRRTEIENFFMTTDPMYARRFLQENKIRYLYLVDKQSFSTQPDQIGLEKIFENGLVKIYVFRDKI